jgi:hypothetical protein
MKGTDRRISQLDQKLAEVDRMDEEGTAAIKAAWEKHRAENPPPPPKERHLPDFKNWVWEDPPEIEELVEKVSIAAAKLVIEQLLDDGAMVTLTQTDTADIEVEVDFGPFNFKVKRSEMDEEKDDDEPTEDIVERQWRKRLSNNDIETWEWEG